MTKRVFFFVKSKYYHAGRLCSYERALHKNEHMCQVVEVRYIDESLDMT